MSAPCKFELSILNHEEKALIQTSHHPEIGDADRATLENLKSSLRKLRDKERTLAFRRRRISKGTAEPRGQSVWGLPSIPSTAAVFVAAMKRVNKEIARLQKFEARKQLGEAARRALSLRRAQQFSRPTNEPTSHEGMMAISLIADEVSNSRGQQLGGCHRRTREHRPKEIPAANGSYPFRPRGKRISSAPMHRLTSLRGAKRSPDECSDIGEFRSIPA